MAIRNALNDTSRKSTETWLNELIWRDFYRYILYYFPKALYENFRHFNIDRWGPSRIHSRTL